jgi:hypothetical protein
MGQQWCPCIKVQLSVLPTPVFIPNESVQERTIRIVHSLPPLPFLPPLLPLDCITELPEDVNSIPTERTFIIPNDSSSYNMYCRNIEINTATEYLRIKLIIDKM